MVVLKRTFVSLRELWRKHEGILLALTSAVLFSLYGLWYKTFSHEISITFALVSRGLIQFVILVVIALFKGDKLTAQLNDGQSYISAYSAITTVMVTGGIRMITIYAALVYVSTGTVMTILMAAPLVIMLMTCCESKITPKMVLCGIFLVIGVGLNSHFGTIFFDTSDNRTNVIKGVVSAAIGLICSSLGNVLSKKSGKNFPKELISAYIGFAMIVAAVPWYFYFESFVLGGKGGDKPFFPTDHWLWFKTLAVGFMGTAQQYCTIAAVQVESPPTVAMFRAFNIPITFILQAIFLIEPTFGQWIGAGLVFSSIIVYQAELKKSFLRLAQMLNCCAPSCGKFREKEQKTESDPEQESEPSPEPVRNLDYIEIPVEESSD